MQHVIWSYSTLLPSIIKIFQRVLDLQSGHKINELSVSNITKGDNAKSKKGRVVILVHETLSGPVLHFCQVPSKYSKGYSSYRADTKFFQIKQRVILPKVRKPELSILYATCHLFLIYISTKYHQNIPKVFKLQSGQEVLCCANGIHPQNNMFPAPTPRPFDRKGDIKMMGE